MLMIKFQAKPFQAVRFQRIQFVRAADVVAELEKQPGNSAHPAARNADEMNGVPFLRQEFCKIDFLRHDCVYFSIVAATRFAASRGARCELFSDIRRSSSRWLIISRIF